jgi:hypothetical protein
MSETFRPRTPRSRSLPSAFEGADAAAPGPAASGVGQLIWPVIMDAHDEVLKNHCKIDLHASLALRLTLYSTGLSPGFRASNPLYMISLLAKRLGADRYPLMVDIDSSATVPSPVNMEQNLLYRFAEGSASLAHAIMMVAASDLALRQVNKSTSERLVIYHKSKALALLNETIRDVQSSGSLETLATAAVLACHEVSIVVGVARICADTNQLVVGDYRAWTVHILGFSRMIAMNGGINYLDLKNPIRQLILWSDQVGALFMNVRPLFPASAVFASSFRLSQNLSPQVTERYQEGGFQGLLFWQRMQAEGKLSDELLDIISDINQVAFIGAQFLLDEATSVTNMISLRDQIIHRLLYLAPHSQEGTTEAAHEACVGLAMLLLTFDRLFSPALPAAYFQLTHLVADRLADVLAGSRDLATEWAGHEWAALWICFVGTSGSTNNPSARGCFVRAGVPLVRRLCRGVKEMDDGLEAGLRGFAAGPGYYGVQLVEAFVGDLRAEVCRRIGGALSWG